MILDAATRLSDSQAITTGTQGSYNVYDTWAEGGATGTGAKIARDNGLRLLCQVTTAFVGGTSLTAYLIESDTIDMASPVTRATSMTLAEAALTVGTKLFDMVVPRISKRYLAMSYFSVGTHTGGAVTAELLFDSDSGDTYPSVTGF